MSKSNTDRLSELGRIVADRVPALIEEARDNLLESIDALVEDAQEQDKEATLRLTITVTWPLNGTAVNVSMPVSVRRKYEAMASLDDAAQPGLFDEATDGEQNRIPATALGIRLKQLEVQERNAAKGGSHD